MRRTLLIAIGVSLVLATIVILMRDNSGNEPGSYDFPEHLDRATFEVESDRDELPAGEKLVLEEGFEGERQWTLNLWNGQAGGGRTRERSHGGEHSFAVWDEPFESDEGQRPGADADVSYVIPVEGFTRYRMVGHVLTDDLTPLGASVHGTFYLLEFSDPNSMSLTARHLTLPDPRDDNSDWRRLEYTFITFQRTTHLKIAGSLGNWGRARGRVFFDDISLWKLPRSGTFTPKGGPEIGDYRLGDQIRRGVGVPIPSTLKSRVRVPANGVLDLALGVPGRQQGREFHPVVFEVTATATDGIAHVLLHRIVSSNEGWKEVKVPLSNLRDTEVDIRFSVRASGELPARSEGTGATRRLVGTSGPPGSTAGS